MTPEAQRIEALLFISGEGVSRDELARVLNCDRAIIDTAISEVADALAGHGLTVIQTPSHVQLVTSQDVSAFLAQFLDDASPQLSTAAAETLALVAYRGPVSRAELDAIRGVDSRRMVRQLLARGLIRRVPGQQSPRRYEVTEEFLSSVGIPRVEDLPRYEILSSHENIERLLK